MGENGQRGRGGESGDESPHSRRFARPHDDQPARQRLECARFSAALYIFNPNSTVELGQRPLIWDENGRSHPQFNAPAISQTFAKPHEIRVKFPRRTTDKPRHTKKLNRGIELGCPVTMAIFCPLPHDACVLDCGGFDAAFSSALITIFYSLLQPATGYYRLLQPSAPRGR